MHPGATAPIAKAALRQAMRATLRAFSAAEKAEASARILAHLTGEPWLRDTAGSAPAAPGSDDVIALFGGLPSEPDLLPLLPWLRDRGARAAYFAIVDDVLQPFEVRSTADLHRTSFGVWEPLIVPSRQLDAACLTALLIPGLAFAPSSGLRLGRGRGYYDRLLARPGVVAPRIGVAFHCQLVPDIPPEPHDAALHALVTEEGWQTIGRA